MRSPIIPEVWGQGAETTIPANPVKGTAYRDETVGQPEFSGAWPFDTIVNSAQFNQALFIMSSVIKAVETNGIAEWSNAIDYPVNAWTRGSDGAVYKSLQTPNVNKNPVTAATFWEPLTLGGGPGGGGLSFGGLISGATNLVVNTRYIYSANSIVTHTLPASPVNGDKVVLDHNEEGSSIVTISGGGKNIRQYPNPTAGTIDFDLTGIHAEFVYSADADEWVVADFSGPFGATVKASQQEVIDGIDNEKYVTPSTLQGKLDNLTVDPLLHARLRLAESGNTPVLIDSLNIASVVRTGAGDYTISFTTPAPNANYFVDFMNVQNNGRTMNVTFVDDGNNRNATFTTTSFQVNMRGTTDSGSQDAPAPGNGYYEFIIRKSNF